jgi:hypothetical protein
MVEKAITARQSDPGLGTFQTTVENNTFVWTGEDKCVIFHSGLKSS